MNDILKVRGLRKRFGDTVALDGFDLDVPRGDLLALLGPSGCGKTTALRIIAGLDRPDGGEVWVGDRLATSDRILIPPEARRIGMVFQEGALFPHLDVLANVAFGLSRGHEEPARRVLEQVRLTGLEHRMPDELSGGQQQRVAVARALAPAPEVVLLDEPFSNLDAALRAGIRADVREVLKGASATAVFVTHDQEEALSIADRIAVMNRGRVLQVGTPQELYEAPASLEVAALVGGGNVLEGHVDDGHVRTALGAVPFKGAETGAVSVLVRPESLGLQPDPDSEAVVTGVEFYGHDQMVLVRLADGTRLRSRPIGSRRDLVPGTRVRASLDGPARVFPR